VVARQRYFGLDLVNDGEYGHAMGERYNYGAWWSYVFQRLSGLELVAGATSVEMPPPPARSGVPALVRHGERRDRREFREAYDDPSSGVASPAAPAAGFPVVRGPIAYRGHDAVARDIANLEAALAAADWSDAYLNSVGPGSCARFSDEFYQDDEALLYACADALREEYIAILDAGLMLQIDDPALAESWDQMDPAPTLEEYKRYAMVRVEALNHAIRGLPSERIRLHLCWGSWHGPHVTDLPLADIVEVMLAVNAGAYSFEAANVRHEHEWTLWHDIELPDGKLIMPGVVSHATNVVEHPELVAQRIIRFALGVGREHVIASTDCGLGGRVHPQIAWAKLDALTQGAALATARLWPKDVPGAPLRY